MKKTIKIINIIAGSFLLLRLVRSIIMFVEMVLVAGYSGQPLLLAFHLTHIIVHLVSGIKAICQKVDGVVLNTIGFALSIFSINILDIIVFSYFLYQIRGSIFNTKDTTSEAAKKKIQAKKQRTIFDDQLRDGIITQEEYDQLIKNQKSE